MPESISLLEPLMPPAGNKKLENLASELIAAAARLNQSVHPILRQELGKLVRSINCYYSNLIEGHRTLFSFIVLITVICIERINLSFQFSPICLQFTY
ncbi:hypothetical protein [Pleurocapsa sp. PCC 7319]|uniref:hypothetical protein n=1 Tax=Pleurocapsa sp. PCC 7319 TaxID=118161 RepID=UPI0003747365|nr:hypothetical protein [Pleurocapsa sp. PCC 7319]